MLDGPQNRDYTCNELTGWSSSYYKLPEDATELQDLIEHRGMNFAIGNIFKAAYRLGEKVDIEYDLDKIIWFALRERDRIRKLKGKQNEGTDLPGSGKRHGSGEVVGEYSRLLYEYSPDDRRYIQACDE